VACGYSLLSLTTLLHQLGFRYKFAALMPCEAAAQPQAAYVIEQLQSHLAQTSSGLLPLMLSHPTYNTCCTWACTKPLPTTLDCRVNL